MSTEKIRNAIRERLEEIYEIELEYQFDLSKVVIPFSEFFKKSDSTDIEKEAINDSKEKYKKLLMQEL
ncbi:MAG: hypothetical protein KGD70_07350 [Candidatus Lokiarchaeota archaeon]|jgi:hypothetical protein|nr:hypothetical protein [Candidatus Lokiarchaeota archaeon]